MKLVPDWDRFADPDVTNWEANGYGDTTAGGDRWRKERRSPTGWTGEGAESIRLRVVGRGLDATIRATLCKGEEPKTTGVCVSFILVESED
jgi:hypothetical protein